MLPEFNLFVYANYNYENSGKNGCVQTINRFVKENHRIIIDITPIDEQEFKSLRSRENSTIRQLAGVKIRAANSTILDYLRKNDPIPRLWLNK